MSPLVLALLACGGDPPAERQPLPSDTGTADVFTIDTGDFLPVDTGITTGTEDDVPTNLLTVSQSGTWSLSPLGGPFTELAGTLVIEEFVDELDPLEPEYACEATYNLTGQLNDESTCGNCDFVFNVTHFVTEGDASSCREPGTPQHEEVWVMAYDSANSQILRAIGGVWVPWATANMVGSDVTYTFDLVIAIQVEEEEEE